MDIKSYFSGPKARVFWINVALMLAVLIIAPVITLYYIDHYTHHGERLEVPSVERMTVEDATDLLAQRGMIAVVTDSVKKAGYAPGTICMQLPKAGSEVKEGRMVYLTVIRTKEVKVVFPDVVGKASVDEARQTLSNMGFDFTEDKIVECEDKALLAVYQGGRKLSAGMSISTEQKLTLHVGSGVEADDDPLDLNDPLFDDADSEE